MDAADNTLYCFTVLDIDMCIEVGNEGRNKLHCAVEV